MLHLGRTACATPNDRAHLVRVIPPGVRLRCVVMEAIPSAEAVGLAPQVDTDQASQNKQELLTRRRWQLA